MYFVVKIYQANEASVGEQDHTQRQQIDQTEDDYIVAHDVDGPLAPLHATARVGALQRIVWPAQQWQHGPQEPVQSAGGDRDQVGLGAQLANVQRLAYDVVAFQWEHRHQIDARAAYEVHEKGAADTALLRKHPPVFFI